MEYVNPGKKSHFYYLLLVAFSSFGFFRPIFLNDLVLKHLLGFYIDVVLLLFLLAVPVVFRNVFFMKNYLFTLPVRLLGLSIIFSIMMAYFFWGQGIMDNIFSEISIICYLLYFYLMAKNIPVKIVEKVIIIVGITYVCFYLISFAINPVKIFEYKESNDRDFLRIFLFGDGFLFLFYFLALNKYMFSKSKIWLMMALLTCLCIILNQTRVYMIAVAIITVFYLLGSKKIVVKFLVVAVVITALIIVPQLDFVKNLQKRTQSELKKSDDYIRVKAAKYYIDDFQPSAATKIFGNGFPMPETYFGKTITNLHEKRGYFVQDIGLVGLYTTMGVIAVIAFLIIFYRGVKVKLTEDYVYLKLFIIFLIATSLTTDDTFSGSYVIAIVFTLYLYEHCRVEAQQMVFISTNVSTPTISN